jgi:hypothetical protein
MAISNISNTGAGNSVVIPSRVAASFAGRTGAVPAPGEKPTQDAVQSIRSGTAPPITERPVQDTFEAIRAGGTPLSTERAAGATTPTNNISEVAPSPVERLYQVGTAPVSTQNANAGVQYIQQANGNNNEVVGLFLDRFF